MATVAEVWRYPVKSMAGERLDSCQVAPTGLEGDRRWALVDGSPNRAGKPLTIREEDRLMTYRARLAGGVVVVMSPGGEVGGVDDRLVSRLAAQTKRPLSLRELEGGNFDDSPVLVVNLATVAAFGDEAGMEVDHRRFRANLYVDGLAPEEELAWIGRRVTVGSGGARGGEPLRAVRRHHQGPRHDRHDARALARADSDAGDVHGRVLPRHATRSRRGRRSRPRGVGNLVGVLTGQEET